MIESKLSLQKLPGTFLMWLILLNEFLVFAGLIVACALFRVREKDLFLSSAKHLNLQSGITATLFLLAGGYFAAEFIKYSEKKRSKRAVAGLVAAIGAGFLFLHHKWQDLGALSTQGFDFARDDFWLFYWGIMTFHFAHVLVAVGILLYILFAYLKNEKESEESSRFFASGVLFWHLCDVIWVMIFPLFFWRP
ncbi:hypothetical protein EZJ49_12330 [Bdellovibrio bacteriovorus]|uniref:hypothetical protein n=1 Tax=Bdellovibrio bacteriovorus TaxID=959 RepID=UPI0021CE273B|nr:hypothetical protein [Bdellovibrio bacteriovorus]UXR63850.1 hypothetical protein EZJ49_12330 [Bdellovibrio bacteriovorus]